MTTGRQDLPDLWADFDAAYKKACESSDPKNYQHAALIAQQVRMALAAPTEPSNPEQAAPMTLADAAKSFPRGPFGQPRIATPPASAAGERLTDEQHYSEQLTRAKRLLVDVWQRHPDARGLIEARTGSWFVWGEDRAALASKPLPEQKPVAALYVTMETHDMGQSLAPNPPFKFAKASACVEAKDLPVGTYDLYLGPLPEQVAQDKKGGA